MIPERFAAMDTREFDVATEALRKTTVKEVKGYLFDVMKQAGLVDVMEIYH